MKKIILLGLGLASFIFLRNPLNIIKKTESLLVRNSHNYGKSDEAFKQSVLKHANENFGGNK